MRAHNLYVAVGKRQSKACRAFIGRWRHAAIVGQMAEKTVVILKSGGGFKIHHSFIIQIPVKNDTSKIHKL